MTNKTWKKKEVACKSCGKRFFSYVSRVNRGEGKYCSIECKCSDTPFINRQGKRFGRLVVLDRAERRYRGHIVWDCLCDCGTEVSVRSDALTSGHAKSCGCITKGGRPQQNRDIAVRKSVYLQSIKRRSGKKGWKEYITLDQYIELSMQNCYWCGVPPSSTHKDHLRTGKIMSGLVIKYNGVDRVDNSKGYTVENSVPCCKYCNRAKNDMTVTQFMEWNKRIYNTFSVRAALVL